ncbi:MAG: UDP-N-acetylmuramate--L-alanine ligase [Candidatus Marinimicrobia bacterium]|nr:UDP-N-acetylmuramate--L-alanine ligase [Candidatus Neomarinimicrobiota bacterium]
MFGRIKKIHFVGLGGIGISGMAELLHILGFKVTGSDLQSSEITHKLQQSGIRFFQGHAPGNINDADMVVYSSAVKADNPELEAARLRNIPVIRRAEMLGELLKVAETSIAVAGTHGKTTTSSMIGTMLTTAQRDPTMVIGGIVKSLGSNTRRGQGDIIVVEADEFDRSFLSLRPTLAVITNLDLEHLDSYENMDELSAAFAKFANAVPFYGRVVACLDEPNLQALLPRVQRPITTYGLAPQADVQARKPAFREAHSEFELRVPDADPVQVKLQVPGEHNIRNALAAVAVGLELQVPLEDIIAGLQQFTGVNRRFEIMGETGNVLFVDDYAHHPREVAAVLKAARQGWDRRLVAVFQPHLYSRTRDFHEDFARSFLDSDVLIVTDVYPAREAPIDGISGELIARDAARFGHKQVTYTADKNDLAKAVAPLLQESDIVLTLGAGDITRYNAGIRKAFAARRSGGSAGNRRAGR